MNLRSRSKVSAEVNMSSMTDLVFLLLIFFILASTLVTSSALDIVLPKSGAQTVKKKNITLTVNEALEFDVNGTIVGYDQVELLFSLMSVIGIFIGIGLSKKIPGESLKKGFGWFVLAMGIYILLKEIFM